MRRMIVAFVCLIALTGGAAHAVVIDFTGGIAYLSTGATVTPTDTMTSYYSNVDYYIEDGVKIDFIGGVGIIGPYYDTFGHQEINNSVIHAHWNVLGSIRFSMVDGTNFDLNYMDLSSNTETGGGAASGNELSYVTNDNGDFLLLPSSDWGIDYLSNGVTLGDGIERLWMDDNFDDIAYFDVTSQNAYCFGLDNFYINEEAPPIDPVPEPSTFVLLGSGLASLAWYSRKRKKA